MQIKSSDIDKKGISLILGFFDGIHLGHREVISSAVNFAKKNNTETVLITFKTSPAEYFGNFFEYIFTREKSYKIIEELGVDYLIEKDFKDLAQIEAEKYLELLIKTYAPISISTGFNHTFGKNRTGNSNFLEENQKKYNYKYLCSKALVVENKVVSSTYIKTLIEKGDLNFANNLLGTPFSITSSVIKGNQLGRKIGFPTANIEYPSHIIKLPYGVYKGEVFGKTSVLNWGIKPTIGGQKEVLEVHIIDFNEDLYGKKIEVKILQKIRNEKKFNSLEELKVQIAKDVEECLK